MSPAVSDPLDERRRVPTDKPFTAVMTATVSARTDTTPRGSKPVSDIVGELRKDQQAGGDVAEDRQPTGHHRKSLRLRLSTGNIAQLFMSAAYA